MKNRVNALQRQLSINGIDALLLTDADAIYYFSGYHNYMDMAFGRPTLLWIPTSGACTLITPTLEFEMCQQMTWIDQIITWSDGIAEEWRGSLQELIGDYQLTLATTQTIPSVILRYLEARFPKARLLKADALLGTMRMVKDPEEIKTMRQAGQVAIKMVEAAQQTIAEGVAEYEVTLAAIEAGTRTAAKLLEETEAHTLFSPMIYNLQVLQSGHETAMVHRRASTRRIARGEPVYLCFCGLANFKQYKLGFDREFFVGFAQREHAALYEIALQAQQAALDAISPGVMAEEVHFAAETVYRQAGVSAGYRTGRSIGCSFLEPPELKTGDKTVLQPGMTFAVDGGITVPHQFGARVGDSIVVTKTGFEMLTPYPKSLCLL